MSGYVGTNFARDVSLIEPKLNVGSFENFGLTVKSVEEFIKFDGDDAANVISFEVDSIKLEGQSLEPGTFHVSDADGKGKYLVAGKLNGEDIGFVMNVTGDVVDLGYTYEMGKMLVTSMPDATGVVQFGNNKFVMVSVSGINGIKLSVEFDDVGKPNMIWNGGYVFNKETKPINIASNDWRSVAYGDGRFVAVAVSGYAARSTYSTDGGETWTESTTPLSSSNHWQSVTYGDGRFVAVANDSSKARSAYSTDGGETWTESTTPLSSSNEWCSVTYGNDRFVALAYNGSVAYSEDKGNTWTASTTPLSSNSWNSVTYGDGRFVAVAIGGSAARSAYSEDGGKTWTESTTPLSSNTWYSVAYGDGRFVSVANYGSAAYSTDGGKTFTDQYLSVNINLSYNELSLINNISSNQWRSVTYGDGRFVAVASMGSARSAYSTDRGETWTESTTPLSSNTWFSVAYGNGRFVAVAIGGSEARSAYSTDGGNTWTASTTPLNSSSNRWFSVAYGNGRFVAVAYDGSGARSAYSEDGGNTWTASTTPLSSSNNWRWVAYGDGRFVAVAASGSEARSAYSTDGGETWTTSATPLSSSNRWNSVTYGDGRFVAVTFSGSVARSAYSTDGGETWTESTTPLSSSNEWQSVTYGDGRFVAVAGSGSARSAYSTDGGETWTESTTPLSSSNYWYSITYGDGRFVAVAYDGSAARSAYSTDGGEMWNTQPLIQSIGQLTTTPTAAVSDISVINDVEAGGIILTVNAYTPATKTTAGTLTVSAMSIHCSKLVITLVNSTTMELHNIDIPINPATGTATLKTKFYDNTSTTRVLLTGAEDESQTLTGTDVTLSTYTLRAPAFTFTKSPICFFLIEQTDSTHFKTGAFKSIQSSLFTAPHNLSLEETIRFHDSTKADITRLTSGLTFYDTLLDPYQNTILNLSTDAGFTIPIARDGIVSTEYIRISDIYSKFKQQESSKIADLPDRLHSLEVGLKYLSSDVLDSDDQEAQHLKSIKNKYSPLHL